MHHTCATAFNKCVTNFSVVGDRGNIFKHINNSMSCHKVKGVAGLMQNSTLVYGIPLEGLLLTAFLKTENALMAVKKCGSMFNKKVKSERVVLLLVK